MSLGYTGMCKKVMEDAYIVLYSYAGENWNDGGKSKPGDSKLQDGMFTVDKQKHISDIGEGLRSGAIKIDKECKNAFWKPEIPADYLAWKLLMRIFDRYKKDGVFPETEAFIQ